MTAERWNQIKQLFNEALALDTKARATFLTAACAGDEELRHQVEAMLAADSQSHDLLDRPAYAAVPELFSVPDNQSKLPTEPPLAESLPERRIGIYQLRHELGRGGMGEVYLAYDARLGRNVALKLLPARFTADAERLRRFQREARTASALNHPNILTIFDIGQEDGLHYIATEFVEGQTLRSLIVSAKLSPGKALDVAMQIASALEAAHKAGIIHRDIKPENVMVRPDGYVKVLDFGLAKLIEPDSSPHDTDTLATRRSVFETRAGMVLGTAAYMSPEQARGQKVDARSDLFSLGVVLYEMLTGKRPFDGATRNHTLVAILDAEPPPLTSDLSLPGLQRLLSRALAKDRDERYQSSQDLLSDLKDLKRELDTTPTGESAQPRKLRLASWTAGQRRRALIVVAALFLAAVSALFYFNRRAPLTERDTILLADFDNRTGEAVFDGTLKQALAVQLGQTPFLNIFPEERVRETLRLMNRPPDSPVTREAAREICQRQGLKALLIGSIAKLGSNYVITLEAVNGQSGEALANQQTEAASKEQVLRALGQAAAQLRKELGESLNSMQRFDTPLEQATTPSLEALKAFSLGVAKGNHGNFTEAIPLYKRAVELDPQFAMAY
ncbi:MAG: protein kinase domain-containing protein, partial [Blastocatellia bacterium]